ncbi:hypothetical protein FK004_12725 [Flavobacterium kingsejongi]|uniref:Uncharacterized protein n=1 Tax=Flavobacterium kingsejongi TaxID=1678728 RepID=A0A2S1LQJ8_9FLAO|nr:hypothetical protein FK004_12725 [Flavobacterium kingsejongi]
MNRDDIYTIQATIVSETTKAWYLDCEGILNGSLSLNMNLNLKKRNYTRPFGYYNKNFQKQNFKNI